MADPNMREMLELAELRRLLYYDPETGVFVWSASNSNSSPVGSVAGRSTNSDGYRSIWINKRCYKAHRLVWFYVHGEWPDQIDHKNGIRDDNRINNLRSVPSKLNTHNQRAPHRHNRSGFLGVSIKANGKYIADIRVNGKKRFLGTYETAEAAHAAYVAAKRVLHEGSTL